MASSRRFPMRCLVAVCILGSCLSHAHGAESNDMPQHSAHMPSSSQSSVEQAMSQFPNGAMSQMPGALAKGLSAAGKGEMPQMPAGLAQSFSGQGGMPQTPSGLAQALSGQGGMPQMPAGLSQGMPANLAQGLGALGGMGGQGGGNQGQLATCMGKMSTCTADFKGPAKDLCQNKTKKGELSAKDECCSQYAKTATCLGSCFDFLVQMGSSMAPEMFDNLRKGCTNMKWPAASSMPAGMNPMAAMMQSMAGAKGSAGATSSGPGGMPAGKMPAGMMPAGMPAGSVGEDSCMMKMASCTDTDDNLKLICNSEGLLEDGQCCAQMAKRKKCMGDCFSNFVSMGKTLDPKVMDNVVNSCTQMEFPGMKRQNKVLRKLGVAQHPYLALEALIVLICVPCLVIFVVGNKNRRRKICRALRMGGASSSVDMAMTSVDPEDGLLNDQSESDAYQAMPAAPTR